MAKTPKYRKISAFLVAILLSGICSAQTSGKVKISADPRLESELQDNIEKNDSMDIAGYRIQIYFGNNKTDAEKLARKFKNLHPEYKKETYLRYYQPYWRVRVGNYYQKVDAQYLLQKLTKDFDNVLLIKDDIELPLLHSGDEDD